MLTLRRSGACTIISMQGLLRLAMLLELVAVLQVLNCALWGVMMLLKLTAQQRESQLCGVCLSDSCHLTKVVHSLLKLA